MAKFILPFEKMHGLGNDFVMLHYRFLPENIDLPALAKKLCDRNFGIGADGIIIAYPARDGGDFAWEYLNSDGSYGEMCGNGMRCFAKYLYDRGLAKTNEFTVETRAGMIKPCINSDGTVTVDMGQPILSARQIPVNLDGEMLRQLPIQVLDREFSFTPVSMGNPHAIVFCVDQAEYDSIDLFHYGPVFEVDQIFPAKTNVEYAYKKSENEIVLKVWERGAGYTLACGTGACATVVAAKLNNIISVAEDIQVHLPGGTLSITWNEQDGHVYMTGAATSVFLGQFELDT